MDDIIAKDKEFKDLIHVIRGQQVMLDSDLAELCGYEVKQFNRQVKNNQTRFPNDFMFELTPEEYAEILRCKNCTSSYGGRRYLPNAFSEQGIYMLSAVLKGELAEKQSIYIIREFKKMRHYIMENKDLFNNTDLLNLSNRILDQDKRINNIESSMATKADINKIMENFIDHTNIKQKIFLDGEIFDAVEAYITIYRQAKRSIYIIDDYINIDTLSMLKKKNKNVNVTVFTRNRSEDKVSKFDIDKFNDQYPRLSLKYANKVHDRFIVIDYGTENEIFYVCGASSKDAGQKVCTITQLYDSESLHVLIDTLLKSKYYVF